MVTIKIDDREIEAPEGRNLLDIAIEEGIEIPHLCHNDSLREYGVCRLCLVEVIIKGRSRIVAACTYPARDGLLVYTRTDKVLRLRRGVMEMHLARAPEAEQIVETARSVGIERSRFKTEVDNCILCGLCVRTCAEIVGVHAIGFFGRGPKRKVVTPFDDPSRECIGCGACAYVCPTGVIETEEDAGMRSIWGREFKMARCKNCGRFFAPMYQLEYLSRIARLPKDHFLYCQTCR